MVFQFPCDFVKGYNVESEKKFFEEQAKRHGAELVENETGLFLQKSFVTHADAERFSREFQKEESKNRWSIEGSIKLQEKNG